MKRFSLSTLATIGGALGLSTSLNSPCCGICGSHRRERARYTVRLQNPPLPVETLAVISASWGFGFVPHARELWHCYQTKQHGLTGRDTPECLPQVFS